MGFHVDGFVVIAARFLRDTERYWKEPKETERSRSRVIANCRIIGRPAGHMSVILLNPS